MDRQKLIDHLKKIGFRIRITDTMLKRVWRILRRFLK